jgi:hypothetical protein
MKIAEDVILRMQAILNIHTPIDIQLIPVAYRKFSFSGHRALISATYFIFRTQVLHQSIVDVIRE